MTDKELIKFYWDKIGWLAEEIQRLANKNMNYSKEVSKRKKLLKRVTELENSDGDKK